MTELAIPAKASPPQDDEASLTIDALFKATSDAFNGARFRNGKRPLESSAKAFKRNTDESKLLINTLRYYKVYHHVAALIADEQGLMDDEIMSGFFDGKETAKESIKIAKTKIKNHTTHSNGAEEKLYLKAYTQIMRKLGLKSDLLDNLQKKPSKPEPLRQSTLPRDVFASFVGAPVSKTRFAAYTSQPQNASPKETKAPKVTAETKQASPSATTSEGLLEDNIIDAVIYALRRVNIKKDYKELLRAKFKNKSDADLENFAGELTREALRKNFRQGEKGGRERRLVYMRQFAMYCMRVLGDGDPKFSQLNIGKYFGGRDHTTVLYAEDKFKALIVAKDPLTMLLLDKVALALYLSPHKKSKPLNSEWITKLDAKAIKNALEKAWKAVAKDRDIKEGTIIPIAAVDITNILVPIAGYIEDKLKEQQAAHTKESKKADSIKPFDNAGFLKKLFNDPNTTLGNVLLLKEIFHTALHLLKMPEDQIHEIENGIFEIISPR